MKVPILVGVLLLAATAGVAQAQRGTTTAKSDYVTREEYDKLKSQMDNVLAELAAMKRERAAPPTVAAPPAEAAPVAPPGAGRAPNADKQIERIDEELRAHGRLLHDLSLGSSKFVIAGDAAISFTAQRHSPSTFEAGFAPLFLWQLNDRLLFVGGLDIGVSTDSEGNSSTSVELTIANIAYTVNDWLIVGGGLFVVPFAQYHNSFDPPWINPLPDDPLAFGDDGIAPSSEVGIYARGGFLVASTRFNYAVYLTNGPQLVTEDPDAAGSLSFDDFTDLNGNKAVGGRIGWLPIPELEVGASIMYGQVSSNGFYKRVNALLWAIDANYRREVDWLYGTIRLRGEWVWSHVDRTTYDPTGAAGFGPLRFANNRNGGYAQLCYRPTRIGQDILKDLELCLRYDRLFSPESAPGGEDEQRLTIGLDYWLAPNAVFKIAWEIDDKKSSESDNALLVQFGIGL